MKVKIKNTGLVIEVRPDYNNPEMCIDENGNPHHFDEIEYISWKPFSSAETADASTIKINVSPSVNASVTTRKTLS